MQVLFVGYGSMAKRHITNLISICNERKDQLAIDLLRHESVDRPLEVRSVYSKLDEIQIKYDVIFITNPTAMHYPTLKSVIHLSDCFFLEKPAFDDIGYDVSIFDSKIIYVACPLRYSSVIMWLKENYDFSQARSLRAISSSYLPDWRPDSDYRKTYSARKDQGGGVSIDLIHEWDYIQYLVGFPNQLLSLIRTKSKLEIDSDDIAVYIGEYDDKVVELHLDYFGRTPIRSLEIIDDEDTLVCNLIASKIDWLKSKMTLSFDEERDDYQRRELMHFLNIIEGKTANDNALPRALRTLAVTKGIL